MVITMDSNIPMLYDCLMSADNQTIHSLLSDDITNIHLKNSETDILICRSTLKVNSELLDGTNVKFVATATTGSEHIDTEYLNANGIHYYATEGANSNSVAEYVVWAMLHCRHLIDMLSFSKMTVGIVGYGNIGTKVGKYMDYMNIKWIPCDPFVDIAENVDIDEIIDKCDVITIHTPLTITGYHPTSNMLNAERINKIKSGAWVILTARGDIYDGDALVKRKDIICVVDVWRGEPSIDCRMLINRASIATPHIAGHSFNGKVNSTPMIIKKLNEMYGLGMSDSYATNYPQTNRNLYPLENMGDSEYLYSELSHSRDLLTASTLMKSQYNLPQDEFAKFFKNYRTNYPRYYEILRLDN